MRRTGRGVVARERARDAERRGIVRGFVVRFVLVWATAIVSMAMLAPNADRWAVLGTVHSLAFVLGMLPLESEVSGTVLRVGGAALGIVPECTPLMPIVLLSAAIAAYPAAWRWKVLGVLFGIVVLWVYNLGRVLMLLVLLLWRREAFFVAHGTVWASLSLFVICGLFLLWLKLQPDARRGAA